MTNKMIKNRNYGIDLLRISSAIAVIILHINAKFISPVTLEENLIWHIINLLTRFSVPCFVMISGAFILSNPKNEDYIYFYKKEFLKTIFPFLLVSFIYILYSFYGNVVIQKHSSEFIKDVITCRFGNLWFMPMIIGLYILVPWIMKIIDTLSMKTVLAITLFLMFWSIISQLTTKYVLPYAIGVVFSYLPYFLLGKVLINFHTKNINKILYGGGVLCFLVPTVILRLKGFSLFLGSPYINFFSPIVIVLSAYIFICIKDLTIENECICRIIASVSNKTYGVYLFHTPIYLIFGKYIENPILIGFLTIIFSFLASYAFMNLYFLIEKRVLVINKSKTKF